MRTPDEKEDTFSSLTILALLLLASLLMEEYNDADALQVACWSSIFLLVILEKETEFRKKPTANIASAPRQDKANDAEPYLAADKLKPSAEKDYPEPGVSPQVRQRFAPRKNNQDSAAIKKTKPTDLLSGKKSAPSMVWEIPSVSAEKRQHTDHPQIHFRRQSQQ
ncbi:MAG: hypothetical protein GXY50_05840 [Syntrophomonadaceae bacterium]|nr:hypothetical protein [Syntrophomonadaceae bacterium]